MTRKYTPIWIKLKQTLAASKDNIGVCRITAHRALHPRIIKAISKEKNIDLGYKFNMAESGLKTIVTHTRDGAELRFFLRAYPLNEKIRYEDLI